MECLLDCMGYIYQVVRWGRAVYANIQKFIQFQLTVNIVALIINFVAACTSAEVPLTAVQLLWVNLIMDTLGALALATEPPTDDLMLKKPVGRVEPLITNVMWRNIFIQAIYQVIILLVLNYSGTKILKLSGTSDQQMLVKNTIIFNAFVFCQLFNEINARRPEKLNVFEGIHKNYLFISIIVITVAFQFVIVEFLNKFAQTTKLPVKWWILCILIGIVSWPLAFAAKFIPLPEKPLSQFFGSCSCKRRKHGQSTRSTSNGLSTTTNSHSSQDLQNSETASRSNNRHHPHSLPNSRSVSSKV